MPLEYGTIQVSPDVSFVHNLHRRSHRSIRGRQRAVTSADCEYTQGTTRVGGVFLVSLSLVGGRFLVAVYGGVVLCCGMVHQSLSTTAGQERGAGLSVCWSEKVRRLLEFSTHNDGGQTDGCLHALN